MSRIPLLVAIDVEPDQHPVDLRPERDWEGFLQAYQYFNQLRSRLEKVTRSPVHFSWFLRMDPSMTSIYGLPNWVAERYYGLIQELASEGDEIGLHPHVSRWNETKQVWFSDFGNQEWVNHCTRTSFEAFEKSFGRTGRACRFGDRWTNTTTLNLIEELGARYDLTVEPGIKAAGLGPAFTGVDLDYSEVIPHPYHPSRDDFRKACADRKLWSIPMSSCPADWVFASLDPNHVNIKLPKIRRNSQASPQPGAGCSHPTYEGCLDGADGEVITGWAQDLSEPDAVVNLDIYDGDRFLNTVPADCFRIDLFLEGKRNGSQAFFVKVPTWMKDGKPHSIHVRVAGTDFDLAGSPRVMCWEGEACPDEFMTAILNFPSQLICKILEVHLLKRHVPYLAMVLRSDICASQAGRTNLDLTFDYLLSHPMRERFVFENPAGLIRRLEKPVVTHV